MVASEYSTGNCASPKINIGAVIKNPEMLKFIPVHLKTTQLCKHAVKNHSFTKICFWSIKNQQIYDNAILKNDETLESVPDN